MQTDIGIVVSFVTDSSREAFVVAETTAATMNESPVTRAIVLEEKIADRDVCWNRDIETSGKPRFSTALPRIICIRLFVNGNARTHGMNGGINGEVRLGVSGCLRNGERRHQRKRKNMKNTFTNQAKRRDPGRKASVTQTAKTRL